jgi:hypothetical protein
LRSWVFHFEMEKWRFAVFPLGKIVPQLCLNAKQWFDDLWCRRGWTDTILGRTALCFYCQLVRGVLESILSLPIRLPCFPHLGWQVETNWILKQVIFYDSDWNPQQDLQAQDRCHRIGQVFYPRQCGTTLFHLIWAGA